MKNPHLGSIELGEDSVTHAAHPHLYVSLPLTVGTAYPPGTVLQVDGATSKLEGGDLTARTYVAVEDIAADDEVALVQALGAVKFEKLLKPNGNALTSAEALALMEKSPLVVI